MKSVAVIAATLATASAFAPAQIGQSSTQLDAFQNELGAQAPLGFFDPLGMLDDADQARFDRLRFVELKHGRIAMLAFLGQITTRSGHFFDGNIDYSGHAFSSYPSGLAAIFGDDAIPKAGIQQILAFIGILELAVMKGIDNDQGNEFVGDFRNGKFVNSWNSFDDATKMRKRAIELNNGRAAMMGILGLMVHEKLGSNMPIIGQL
ncbi:hypothetical protein THAOC_36248 [Thalassiosira oceanica]|uniref:Uncharacterized protein n=1 Tax=Thalassiosira oceanica TaxID=159749 RepID=K0R0I4_THAOC|nr:hypothetical protein THAOC_36248 [Thalassiosira oceanica]|eukprot:EJK45155.1 hypothetical protein THAOC_36248 [Thalassiosira oceanica]